MKIIICNATKVFLITIISVSLFSCSSNSLSPDNVRATDFRTVSYDAKLAFQPADGRLGFVVEGQGVSGQDSQYFPAKSYYDIALHSDQIRPETTTHDEFSLMSNSIGLKWNV